MELLSTPFQCCVLPNFLSAAPSTDAGCLAGVTGAARSGAYQNGGLREKECRSVGSGTEAPSEEEGSEACKNGGSATETLSGGDEFLRRLVLELLKLKFYEKNNDLYQFHQVSKYMG